MRRNRKVSAKVKKDNLVAPKQFWWLGVLLLAITCYEVCIHFAEPRLLPIKYIKLQARCERLDDKIIKKHMDRYVKGFFSTDVMKLKQKLLEIPFVDEINIKRIWPDTLLVTILEQRFVAIWGDSAAVSAKGEVAAIKEVNDHLPKFVGPEGQAAAMLETYNVISKIIEPSDLRIKELDLNGRRSWQMTLNNDVRVILGRKDIEKKLQTLMTVYRKLMRSHHGNMDTIDLRYPNGICVHTK